MTRRCDQAPGQLILQLVHRVLQINDCRARFATFALQVYFALRHVQVRFAQIVDDGICQGFGHRRFRLTIFNYRFDA